ncbi:MAG: 2-hydroxyacid dehydrogenase [Brevundimonas sp.]|uniref:2-hydroxyacid dehydrogenase n=1 Tax=Brevundimonas sp. TaxID=1871086 RepID=UPI0027346AB1|nr:2-hydroxyacid dehydrogenase [Brevundimonas sp.]MDP3405555.1 2-hydroxyacid dehydrogenase [Brevundimonas sp.]
MTERPEILIVSPALAGLVSLLESGFIVHRLWADPAGEALARVSAVVVLGEEVLEPGLLERLPGLRHVACFTSGYDGIDVAGCRARGLVVTHAPGVNHEDVADQALGLILAVVRGIVAGHRTVTAGDWVAEERLMTPRMRGRRVGIVGLGAIGEAVAQRVAVMGCEVRWWGPRDKPGADWPRAGSLIDLAAGSDVLVVACRADETNRGQVSAAVIEALGPQGVLINVARGSLVDEDALIAALKAGRLGGAGLDVFATEPTPAARWAGVPHVVLTPHSGGATQEAVQGMAMLLLRNLMAVAAGEEAVTPVR